MASKSVKQRLQAMSSRRDSENYRFLFNAILADLGAHVTPVAASIVDYTAGRAEIIKSIADYTAGRAEIVKDIADYAAGRAEIVKDIADYAAGRAEIVKCIADYTAGRAEIVKDLADYAAGRAEIVKLVTDLGVNNTMLTNIKTFLNGLRTFLAGDSIINPTVVAIGSTPENVATSAFQFMIDGVAELKAAVTVGTAFTDADTINTGAASGSYWGAWLVQIAAGGTITTHSVGADQVYADEAAAIAALPAAEAGNLAIGYVTVNAKDDVDWVAATDDLTDGSDCETATFYSAATDIPAAIADTVSATASAPAAVTASDPAAVTASGPAAVTASDPAAVTASNPAAVTALDPGALTLLE